MSQDELERDPFWDDEKNELRPVTVAAPEVTAVPMMSPKALFIAMYLSTQTLKNQLHARCVAFLTQGGLRPERLPMKNVTAEALARSVWDLCADAGGQGDYEPYIALLMVLPILDFPVVRYMPAAPRTGCGITYRAAGRDTMEVVYQHGKHSVQMAYIRLALGHKDLPGADERADMEACLAEATALFLGIPYDVGDSYD